jgi:hypothetical protein
MFDAKRAFFKIFSRDMEEKIRDGGVPIENIGYAQLKTYRNLNLYLLRINSIAPQVERLQELLA